LTRTTDVFAPHGPLATALPRYEQRQVQTQMTAAVEQAIEQGGVLLAEAGTGTGKTLAYLVPAILSGLRVIVSTGTKNLQEQIFFKDIAFLEDALGISVEAAYLKGQDNYLCLRRLRDFFTSPAVLAHPSHRVAQLTDWSRTTVAGDRMEIEGLPDDDPIWREVCSTQETRIGQKCGYFEACHVTRARQQAQRARIIVVNHHLYFADLATRLRGGAILPGHDAVVFDEAHLIEDVATEFFSLKVSDRRVGRLLRDTLGAVRSARLADDPYEDRRKLLAEAARSQSQAMFGLFRGETGRARLEPAEISDTERAVYHKLDSALDAVEQSVRVLEGRDQGVDHMAQRCATLRADLAAILDESTSGLVHWVETRTRSVVLGASPIDVSGILREGVFYSIPSVVLTSATLSAGGEFSYLCSRLGIDFDSAAISLPAPFDFARQACLFVPQDICDPREPNFPHEAAQTARDLARVTEGGALVLCTSLRNMKAIHSALEGQVPGPLLIQGSAPKTALLRQFTADRSSVLVATTSFWQGVDIPGDALRLVVIDKLPFASPGDPIVAARIEHVAGQGKSAFTEYQVPQAALVLKQGFGRLIRTRHDRGVVGILDRRLRSMAYAKTFFDSLPPCQVLERLEQVEQWWASSGAAPSETA
jgi:ATP-dependent DNA helicase DinG